MTKWFIISTTQLINETATKLSLKDRFCSPCTFFGRSNPSRAKQKWSRSKLFAFCFPNAVDNIDAKDQKRVHRELDSLDSVCAWKSFFGLLKRHTLQKTYDPWNNAFQCVNCIITISYKAGYTANTSCARVGRGENARFHHDWWTTKPLIELHVCN